MNNPYYSKRQSVHALHGVVATSEGLAAQVGRDILKQGGNAIDAAVATAAALTVVEPTSNGIGSDCFALVYTNNKLYGMNASGPTSRNISIEEVKKRGHDTMPVNGLIPVTIPGTPKGWASLIKRFGTMSLKDVLQPAVDLARNGFIVSETVGFYWKRAIEIYKKRNNGKMYEHFFNVFTKEGVAYEAGDVYQSEYHASTLEQIGKTNADSFYLKELADKIVAFMNEHDGFIDHTDLSEFDVEYVEPIHVNYKGYDICEIPPNGQGITALMALKLLEDETLESHDIMTYHKQIEALKIAFSDTLKYVTDPDFMKVNPQFLLSDEYKQARKKLITDTAALYDPIDYKSSGTVYLATADNDGNMVSFIQSNYMGFGSGIVVDDTGISLQNRGHTFSLDSNHHNKLEPQKRTYHTIIPGFIMKDNKPVGPFGVMGGFMQPQGHMQVIMNMIDFKMDPQQALDAPRFRWDKDKVVAVEQSFDSYTMQQLQQLGHKIKIDVYSGGFGRGQIIQKTTTGYIAGTETRCDGTIAYY